MSIKLILLVCALVCELLATFGAPRINWMTAGFCFLIVALFLVP